MDRGLQDRGKVDGDPADISLRTEKLDSVWIRLRRQAPRTRYDARQAFVCYRQCVYPGESHLSRYGDVALNLPSRLSPDEHVVVRIEEKRC